MNRLQLFSLLRRHKRLAFKRNPAFEQGVAGKVMMYIGGGFMAIYMIAFGVMMAVLANKDAEPGLLIGILPLFLIFDFGSRFLQQTPAMMAKPYMLVPMPMKAVVESFLLQTLLSGSNAVWLFLFVPYAIITWAGGASFGVVMLVLLTGVFAILFNSQWYLLVRTLINRSLLWWLLPLAFYACYVLPLFSSNDRFDAFEAIATALCTGAINGLALLALLVVTGGLFFLNRHLQFRYLYEEISREQKKPENLKTVSQFAFLERFGLIGEYLRLEIKSILRNKTIRSRAFMSLALIVCLSLIVAYTDIYDGKLMLNFWCFYCFSIYSMTTLVKVMSPEGNYIDFLMTQHESILQLLKAKYIFHGLVLFFPLLLMLPAVIAGKFSLLMMLAYMLNTSGVAHFLLFQLAVYNKQTLPLNQKITGKGNFENGVQLFFELSAMFLPVVLVSVLLLIFPDTTAYLLLCIIGLLFTLSYPIWLRNIYNRLMKRKYEHLEGFRATR